MRLAILLHTLASRGQYGHARSPRGYYMSEGYCAFYWENRGVVPDYATWQRIARLSARYQRFCNYVTEIKPQWKRIYVQHYADNSVEATERSRVTGKTRQVLIAAPGGDASF